MWEVVELLNSWEDKILMETNDRNPPENGCSTKGSPRTCGTGLLFRNMERSQEQQNRQGWPALGRGSLMVPGHGDSTTGSDPEEKPEAHGNSVGLGGGGATLGFEVVEIHSMGGTLTERGERERQGCFTWAFGGATARQEEEEEEDTATSKLGTQGPGLIKLEKAHGGPP